MAGSTSDDDTPSPASARRPLRELRAQRLLTIRELARLAGVAPTTVHEIELGALTPGPRIIRRIAAALEVTPDEVAEFRPRSRELGDEQVVARLEAMGYPRGLALRIAHTARVRE